MHKKILVSAIFDNLHGSDLGGRPSRGEHYRYSLKSLMKMSDAEFYIFSNDIESHKQFFIEKLDNNITNYKIQEYDLRTTEYASKINAIKNVQDTRGSFRCIELQYAKLLWLEEISNLYNEEDYIFWIDAGLSYSGLLPDKYLEKNGYYEQHFSSNIFSNTFLDNLINFTDDKIFIIGKENQNFFWDHDLPDQYYNEGKDRSYHIIGGLFGGKVKNVKVLCDKFKSLANTLLDAEKVLYSEENILTGVYCNNKDIFNIKTFDIWWHENNIIGNVGQERADWLLANTRCFYKVLEELL
jgi:hypothetical protein